MKMKENEMVYRPLNAQVLAMANGDEMHEAFSHAWSFDNMAWSINIVKNACEHDQM
jgi:hypothetical protein